MKKSKDKSIPVLVIGWLASILLGIGVATPLGWRVNEIQAWTEIEVTVFNKTAFIIALVIATIGIGITTTISMELYSAKSVEKHQNLLED